MSGSYGETQRVRVEIYQGDSNPKPVIMAKIPYWDGRGPDLAKQVGGARALYDESGPRKRFLGWTYPLDMQSCRSLRRVFAEALSIGPELHEWAQAQAAEEERLIALRSASDAELDPYLAKVAPRLAQAVENRKYQKVGINFVHDAAQCILADDMGLGKTLQVIGALELDHASRVVVFCKKTAMRVVWQAELEKWLPDAQAFVAEGSRAERTATIERFHAAAAREECLCVLICNIEMARVKRSRKQFGGDGSEVAEYPGLFTVPWHAIVVDESHRALIGKSVLTQSVKDISQTRLGMYRLPTADGAMKVAISGTPYRGKIINIWGTLNWLHPDIFTSYWNFAKTYFDVYDGDRSMEVSENIRPDAVEDYDRMMSRFMLRRSKAEAAPDLPAKVYPGQPVDPDDPESPSGVWLDLSPAQARLYKQVTDDGVVEFDSGGKMMVNGILAMITRERQFATSAGEIRHEDGGPQFYPQLPSAKFDWIADFLEDIAGNDSKVIIASQFTKIVNLFSAELTNLGIGNFVLTGETSQEMRERIVRSFQDAGNPTRVILINTRAGGESITLDGADYVIIVDETSIPDDQLQVEDRAHRVSRDGAAMPVTVYYLRTRGTIEEDIARACEAREGACRRSLDGSRGVEIMKKRVAAGALASDGTSGTSGT